MCDCYGHECAGGCGRLISMHISDYCTERENVHPYCPTCTRKLSKKKIAAAVRVFWDNVEDNGQVDRAHKGSKVVILCDDPEAYGVHLN